LGLGDLWLPAATAYAAQESTINSIRRREESIVKGTDLSVVLIIPGKCIRVS
jgi:hypothetical protein